MGRGIHRKGDMTTGHDDSPPTTAAGCSDDVFANGMGVVRQGDPIVPHGKHSGAYAGDSTVFVNGKPVQGVGSKTTCGDTAVEGSDNVYIGG